MDIRNSKTFNMKRRWILSKVFQHLMSWLWFCFGLLFPVCSYSGLLWWIFIYWIMPASLGWNLLDHGWWCFWCVLRFGFEYFIEKFCINVHKGHWSEIWFLCCVFLWFRYQSDCGIMKWICQCSFCYLFCKIVCIVLVLALFW